MAASVSTKLAYWLATTLEVRQPSTNSALFLEIITTLLELQQFFPSRLYSNSLLLGQSVVDNHPLFKVAKFLDLQIFFLELNTPIFYWLLLSIILLLQLFAIHLILSARKYKARRSVMHTSCMSLYVYIFYFVTLVANLCFVCLSMRVYKNDTVANTDFPLVTNSDQSYSSVKIDEFKLFWGIDTSIQCYGGEYFITAVVGFAIHLLNMILLSVSFSLSLLYPTPKLSAARTGVFGLLGPIGFLIISNLRFVYSENRLFDKASIFFWTIICYEGFALANNLFNRCYFDKRLVFVTVVRPIVILYFQILLMMEIKWRASGDYDQSDVEKRTSSQSSIAVLFAIPLFIKVVWYLLGEDDIASSSNKTYYEHKKLLYYLETFKQNSTNPDLSLKFQKLFILHKQACQDIYCQCRYPNRLYLYYGLLKRVDRSSMSIALFVSNYTLEKKLHSALLAQDGNLRDASLDAFYLYSMYSLHNLGPTNSLILLLTPSTDKTTANANPPTNFSNFSQSSRSASISKKFMIKSTKIRSQLLANKFENIRITIVKELLQWKMKVFNKDNYSDDFVSCAEREGGPSWMELIKKRKVGGPRKGDHKENQIRLDITIAYINMLRQVNQQILEAMKLKKLILSEIYNKGKNLVALSIGYLEVCHKIEKICERTHTCGKPNFEVFAFNELFYWAFVKEDYYKARDAIERVSNRRFTKSLGSILPSIDPQNNKRDKLIALAASGETYNYHTITYASSEVKDLQFEVSELVGSDMKKILPRCIEAFHNKFFEPDYKLSYGKQKQKAMDLFTKTAEETVIPSSVVMRINHSLDRGLEYLGWVAYSSVPANDTVYLLFDETLVLTDACAYGKKLFQKSSSMRLLNEDMYEYLKLFLEKQEMLQKFEEECSTQPERSNLLTRHNIMNKPLPMTITMNPRSMTGRQELLIVTTENSIVNAKAMTFRGTFTIYRVKEFSKTILTLALNPLIETFSRLKHSRSTTKNPTEKKIKDIKIPQKVNTPKCISFSMIGEPKSESSKAVGLAIMGNIGPLPLITQTNTLVLPEEDLKYAQQTTYEDGPRQRDPDETINIVEKLNPRSIVETLKMQEDNTLMNYIFVDSDAPPVTSIKSLLPSQGRVIINTRATPDSRSNDKDLLKRDEPIDVVNFFKRNLERRTEILNLSRFIYRNMDLSGIKTITVLFAFMYVLLIGVAFGMYYRETLILQKFPNIISEVIMLDAHEFFIWTCTQQFLALEMGRMVKEGLITETSFDEFNYNGTTSHINQLYSDPGFLSQLPASLNRYLRRYSVSSFREYHDFERFVSTELKILVLDESDRSLKFVQMKPYDAARYTNKMFDKFMTTDPLYYPTLSSIENRRDSPKEELIRYNFQNPLSSFFHESKWCRLPSLFGRSARISQDFEAD